MTIDLLGLTNQVRIMPLAATVFKNQLFNKVPINGLRALEKKTFEGFLPYMGVAAILVM